MYTGGMHASCKGWEVRERGVIPSLGKEKKLSLFCHLLNQDATQIEQKAYTRKQEHLFKNILTALHLSVSLGGWL